MPSLLRIETTTEQKEIEIPKFLDVIREVTHDDKYSSLNMADTNHKMNESDKKAIKEKIKPKVKSVTGSANAPKQGNGGSGEKIKSDKKGDGSPTKKE